MIERNTMAANKQAVLRYITIDKCLSRGPSTIKEIKTACDEVMKDIYGHTISIHSVRNDIANMRDRLMIPCCRPFQVLRPSQLTRKRYAVFCNVEKEFYGLISKIQGDHK